MRKANVVGAVSKPAFKISSLLASVFIFLLITAQSVFAVVLTPRVVKIAAGMSHNVALMTDGTLWAWGDNNNGQLGLGWNVVKNIPTQVGTDTDWSDISAGSSGTLALKSNGTLWAWGVGVGDGTWTTRYTPIQIGTDTNWSTLPTRGTNFAIKSDGSLWGWGQGGVLTPTRIGTDTNWTAISVGYNHTLALKSDGSLWSWGYNSYGQLGIHCSYYECLVPNRVGTDTNWKAISAGVQQSMAIKSNGTLWAWGYDYGSVLGLGTWSGSVFSPTQVGTDTNWSTISTNGRQEYYGGGHAMALKSDGSLWGWGNNQHGELGNGATGTERFPIRIGTETNWSAVLAGREHTVALKSNGTISTWGRNDYGQLGTGITAGAKMIPTRIGTDANWSAVSAGGRHSIGMKSDGTFWSWGIGAWGQLGNGTWSSKNMPAQVGSALNGSYTNWGVVSAGNNHAIALKNDGSLWAWGANNYAQVNGSGISWEENASGWGAMYYNTNVPWRIATDTNWIAVDAGLGHSMAIKGDGTLWAWGLNSAGECGVGYINNTVPSQTQVGTDTNWSAVSAGGQHTVALKSDGSLWSWGRNYYGQLGYPTATGMYGAYENMPIPTRIGTDTNWSTVSAGSGFTVALKSDGTLWAWGWGYYLGDGTTVNKTTPVQIGTDTNWSAISANSLNTMALKTDGSLWAWGSGYLGDGTVVFRNIPTKIGTDTNWRAISAGNNHTLALKSDGSLWAWGENLYGQLGDGSEWRETPTQVTELIVSLTLTPDATSIPLGGILGYTVTSTNNSSTSQTFNYWTYENLPAGGRYPAEGELFGPETVTLAPGQTQSSYLTHSIPVTAPLGSYIYHGNVGQYPAVLNSSGFTFTVTP